MAYLLLFFSHMILMLANQRFLSGHYDEALSLYNQLIESGDVNSKILRRRLVCEIVAGSIERAVAEALEMLHTKPEDLLQFVPSDDCPCNELIHFISRNEPNEIGKFRQFLLSLFGCLSIEKLNSQDLLLSQNEKIRQWTKEILQYVKVQLCLEN
ncbi:MAG: hypothetical protein N2450_02805 [bacterium]|nr:hypothetical protein [bacterium]